MPVHEALVVGSCVHVEHRGRERHCCELGSEVSGNVVVHVLPCHPCVGVTATVEHTHSFVSQEDVVHSCEVVVGKTNRGVRPEEDWFPLDDILQHDTRN